MEANLKENESFICFLEDNLDVQTREALYNTFGGSRVYIPKGYLATRNEKILKLWDKYKTLSTSNEKIFQLIASEINELNIYPDISKNVVRKICYGK